MPCSICDEEYNQQEREPKVLPCGHTVCLRCLQQMQHWQCPTCRKSYSGPPESLPKNFELLELMERLRIQGNNTRFSYGRCKGCRAPATTLCWDVHEVWNTKAALDHYLHFDVLSLASASLKDLQTECKGGGGRAMRAITLLDRESWELTLRGGDHVLTGVVGTTMDPLIKAMCLIMAARVDLTQEGAYDACSGQPQRQGS
ncbi:uncharacterized protein LOC113208760 [Frankliniella occidentalis]|uniref:Uncharacterized protein LOC113208760 n=1 Tax=Frankliniella occidentalis TaxID=133901 RepID=A0A9C6UC72_FRAOC|nr:uncharacterized protein LOC113208760 [Frankliniella occidentalis]